jgi:hypothetical protein
MPSAFSSGYAKDCSNTEGRGFGELKSQVGFAAGRADISEWNSQGT